LGRPMTWLGHRCTRRAFVAGHMRPCLRGLGQRRSRLLSLITGLPAVHVPTVGSSFEARRRHRGPGWPRLRPTPVSVSLPKVASGYVPVSTAGWRRNLLWPSGRDAKNRQDDLAGVTTDPAPILVPCPTSSPQRPWACDATMSMQDIRITPACMANARPRDPLSCEGIVALL